MGGTMRLGLYPAQPGRRLDRARGLRRDRTSTSATATATRSTTTTAAASRRRASWFSGTSPGRPARRVRRAAARRAPVLRRDPGAPRAALAADQGAPAVRAAWSGAALDAPHASTSRSRTPDVARLTSSTPRGPAMPSRSADEPVAARWSRAEPSCDGARVGRAPRLGRPRRRPDRRARLRRAPRRGRRRSRSTTHDRVLLVRQYRHPVGMMLWEPVAGLLDVADECAARSAPRASWSRRPASSPTAGTCSSTWRTRRAGRARRSAATSPATWRPRPAGARPATARSATCRTPGCRSTTRSRACSSGRLTAPLTVAGVLAAYACRARRVGDAAPGRLRVARARRGSPARGVTRLYGSSTHESRRLTRWRGVPPRATAYRRVIPPPGGRICVP